MHKDKKAILHRAILLLRATTRPMRRASATLVHIGAARLLHIASVILQRRARAKLIIIFCYITLK